MATGDILAVRFSAAAEYPGMVAEIDVENLAIGGTYDFGIPELPKRDPVGATVLFTLTQPGYVGDQLGVVQQVIHGVPSIFFVGLDHGSLQTPGGMRKAYPNELTADESVSGTTLTLRIVLSDHVYAGDTATVTIAAGFYTQGGTPTAAFSGSVTNNATLTHPQVIAHWASRPFEVVRGDFVLEIEAFHRSGRDGKPIAGAKCVVTDGVFTETVLVTKASLSDELGVGRAFSNKVTVYKFPIPIAAFIQGATLTCNFTAYPIIGDAGATFTSATGVTPPSELVCPLLLLCDKNSTYGEAYVVVDDTNGAAVTTWDAGARVYVYSTQAAAEAAYAGDNTLSVQYLGRAVQCIRDFNNDTYGRNEPGGGFGLLTGTHALPGTVPAATQNPQQTWFTLTRHSQVTRAGAIVNMVGSSALKAQRLRLYDVSIAGTGSGGLFGQSATDALLIDRCAINSTTTNVPFGGWKTAYATRNEVIQLSTSSTGNGFVGGGAGVKAPFALVRGNQGPLPSEGRADGMGILCSFYCVIGNDAVRPRFSATGALDSISDGSIVAFNSHFNLPSPWISSYAATPLVHGNAFVMNLLERTVVDDWIILVDQDGVAANHVILWFNTLAGARVGVGFSWNVAGFALKANYSQIGGIFAEYGTKDDATTPQNALRRGSLSVGHHLGCKGNHRFTNAGTDQLRGEFSGIHTVDFGTLGFINDRSLLGSNDGNGDYHLTPLASGFDLVPPGAAPMPFDLGGTHRNLTSGGSAGVFESNALLVQDRRSAVPCLRWRR